MYNFVHFFIKHVQFCTFFHKACTILYIFSESMYNFVHYFLRSELVEMLVTGTPILCIVKVLGKQENADASNMAVHGIA